MKKNLFKPGLSLSIILWLVFSGNFSASAQTETLSTGSYIINMGVVPQTRSNALKPYGLVYDLLKNYHVPIKWVISPVKVKDGADFTYNGVDYKGGTFIIPAEYRNSTINGRISFFGVTGTTTTSPLTVNVTYTLTSAPRWTLDEQNGNIAEGFFDDAGIPSSAYNYKTPSELNGCNDLYVMPHADPSWSYHGPLYNWVRNNKGSFWGGCRTGSGIENLFNPANTSQQMNFLSTNVGAAGNAMVPYDNHSDGTPPYINQFPNSPVAQYMGTTEDAQQSGSEQIYLPKLGGGWRPTTQVVVYDPTQSNVPGLSPGPAASIVYGRAFGNANYGWGMYEGGHDLGGTNEDEIAAQRVFWNFSLLASFDHVPVITALTISDTVTSGNVYSASITASSPVGSTLSYQWSSACGGSFSNPTGQTTNFYPPAVTTATSCIIKCMVTDACGRTTFFNRIITVLPPDCNCVNQSGNLLVNPSFENGSTGWSTSGAGFSTENDYRMCGNLYGLLDWSSGTARIWQDVIVTEGSTVNFKGYAGTHTSGISCSPRLSLIYLNAANAVISQSDVTITKDVDETGNALELYSINGTAPTGTVKVRVQGSITCNYLKVDGFCLTVIPAPPVTNPDFNSTFVNVPVPGNVNTNDKVPAGTTYGTSPTLLSSPPGSSPVLTMNSNGTYSFVSNIVGVYTYDVPVCVPGQSAPCPPTKLVITVLGAGSNTNAPVANVDIATTPVNTPVTLKTLVNDAAGNPIVSLVPSSVIITVAPLHGTASVNTTTGDITYTPQTGYTGTDTLTYRVCDDQTPAKCAEAKQIVTIKPAAANNTTTAADDYKITPLNTPATGNVRTNDSDPEGHVQTVTGQTTTVPGKGSLVLASNGSYVFTPFAGFTGPVDFPYTTCDNGSPQACASATLHLLVLPAVQLPDLTPSIFNDGTTLIQNTSRDNVIRIFNIGVGPTSGTIIFTVPKMLPAFDITINPTETFMNVFGGTAVANNDWTITEQAARYVFTSKPGVVIPAFGYKDVGIKVKAIGIKNSTGNLTIQIVFGTGGGETPYNNNSDNNTYSTN